MSICDSMYSRPFLAEVSWARNTIIKIREHKVKNLPVGLDPETAQPDALFIDFAQRGLTLELYVPGRSISFGSPEAYMHDVALIVGYVARRRQEELRSASDRIREILALKAEGWPVGLSWPDGQPDSIATYFALRGLPVASFIRGKVNVGDDSAYDRNIATLKEYVHKVGAEQVR